MHTVPHDREYCVVGMLSENASAVLRAIDGICGDDGFKIVEAGDLLSALPLAEAGQLGSALADLERQRLIEIKYAEEGVYCLRPLPEGRGYFEAALLRRRETDTRFRELFVCSALGGFTGALVGFFLAWLIALLTGGI